MLYFLHIPTEAFSQQGGTLSLEVPAWQELAASSRGSSLWWITKIPAFFILVIIIDSPHIRKSNLSIISVHFCDSLIAAVKLVGDHQICQQQCSNSMKIESPTAKSGVEIDWCLNVTMGTQLPISKVPNCIRMEEDTLTPSAILEKTPWQPPKCMAMGKRGRI